MIHGSEKVFCPFTQELLSVEILHPEGYTAVGISSIFLLLNILVRLQNNLKEGMSIHYVR
jgi:hypothetical protein